MTPTLTVPGPAEDWLPSYNALIPTEDGLQPGPAPRVWVPVTMLPAVPCDEWVSDDRGGGYSEIVVDPRPLRAGDTVALATWGLTHSEPPEYLPDVPLATAEVAEVVAVFKEGHTGGNTPMRRIMQHDSGRFYFEDCETGEIVELPGDWSSAQYGVRLTNVEALSGHVDSAVTPEEAQALRVESINERHARLRGES